MAREPIRLRVEGEPTVRLSARGDPPVTITPSEHLRVQYSEYPDYAGPTEVTPSGSAQTLATSGTVLHADVVVAPIPSNYGLITWNGAVLTVS